MYHNLCPDCEKPLIYPRDKGYGGLCQDCYREELKDP